MRAEEDLPPAALLSGSGVADLECGALPLDDGEERLIQPDKVALSPLRCLE